MLQRTFPPVGGAQDVFHARSSLVPLPLITRASGVHMWDDKGRDYIDVSSGPVVSNIGHGNPRVARAMMQQAETLDFAYSRQARHLPNVELAERIASLAGPGFERVALSSGGSEAIEIALKLMRQHALVTGQPSRRRLISCMPSYHGSTIGTLGIDGDESLLPFLDGFATVHEKVPAPFSYRVPGGLSADAYAKECIAALDATIERLGPETVLGFIIEPVGGLATGCLVPPDFYFRAVREICSRHGIHLVFDEVLCGSGRTGRFLTAHHYPDAQPDIVVLAKGLGAGYAPLGATLASHRMVEEIAAGGGFNFMHTYAANPVSCAAGIAVLEEYRTGGLIDRAATLGARLHGELRRLQSEFPVIGDIRGRGMLYAVEVVEDPTTKRPFPASVASVPTIRRLGLENGLMIYARQTAGGKYGDWFMVSPPLTMTDSEADEMVARLRRTFEAFVRSI